MRIGILGGTFDPPHIGHLVMAEEARIQCGLDQVWWMPNKIPPHKEPASAAENHRLAMVEHMARLSPWYELCLEEISTEGPSYTANTITSLMEKYPEHSFSFIMGGDSLEHFHRWKSPEHLKQQLPFIVVSRPDTNIHGAEEGFSSLRILEDIELHISSTDLRNRRRDGRWNSFLVTKEVNEYIKEHQLYVD
ncbi:nicotinate (nicotinamide) nucleotide adenylyltransferase [Alkalicoccus urumqiensis]|uniref:Probable nicotinate-nucleotide adenylyltransferase n=1 Tax=Alkalicoccus urumqiensis TaxID=1548213 RepID=A0A2P6MFM3_ALKUR|nr:nicotinate (nicotinamide) nucleotide adenylyltransferase [Alkalicoccus urumqiensis]PRO65078.1 nicotinate (nicotinamide) nucleotide adenylyltransferase [Alkalicoccus urumqiensis]